jgi:hypothetical protein
MKRPRWYRKFAVALIVVMFVVGVQLIVSTTTTMTTAAAGFTTLPLVKNAGDTLMIPPSASASTIQTLTGVSAPSSPIATVSNPSITEHQQKHPDSRRRPPPADNNSKPHCLVFFHVPKTAGTSVRRLLRQLSRELGWKFQMWYDGESQSDLMTNTRTNWTQGVLHAGHITPRFLEVTGTQSCLRLTVLREPVDRVISLYFFLLDKRRQAAGTTTTTTTTTPAVVAPAWQDCLFNRNSQMCMSWHQYQNEVTRLFATSSSSTTHGRAAGEDTSRDNSTSNLPWTAVTTVPAYTRMPMNAATLAMAQQFLWRETDFVCFQDRLEDCEQAVRRLLRLTTTTTTTSLNVTSPKDTTTKPPTASSSIPKVNVNAKRPANITADLRDQIWAANDWDVQLYDWARETFLETTDIH